MRKLHCNFATEGLDGRRLPYKLGKSEAVLIGTDDLKFKDKDRVVSD